MSISVSTEAPPEAKPVTTWHFDGEADEARSITHAMDMLATFAACEDRDVVVFSMTRDMRRLIVVAIEDRLRSLADQYPQFVTPTEPTNE